ncbi:MAG: helix-turn-helix transcriptional regulator [Thiothrix sp.]|uniref:helix-turn-helix domain-containing protein n=1 Tax=Thiothrix sp. TaxID=1032 RepID=UPI002612C3C7|nr:helix-turn-helix transcriptional regulator [Thiothrix sp.]MDD5392810.1 helix-turn-helix transcriptional regulator [Thiothrix sp.]
MKTEQLLDAAREKLGLSSDYALAKAIGVGKGRIGHYRTGLRKPDEQACFQLAEILEIEPAAVIAAVRLEGEREPGKVEFWKRQAARYATSAGVVATLLAGNAQAQNLGYAAPHGNFTPYALCEIKKGEKSA